MERKDQLRNVAFGGAWSEQIAGREELVSALSYIKSMAGQADMIDIREDAVLDAAIDLVTADHPKREMLQKAWRRAAALPVGTDRVRSLKKIAKDLTTALDSILNTAECDHAQSMAANIKPRHIHKKT